MSSLLYRLGRFAVRKRRIVVASWILALLLIGLGGQLLGGHAVDDFAVPGTEAQQGRDVLEQHFAAAGAGARAQVVVEAPKGRNLAQPGTARREVDMLLRDIGRQPGVVEVSTLTPSPIESRIGFASVFYDADGSDLGSTAGKLLLDSARTLRSEGFKVEFGGDIHLGAQELGGASEKIGLGVAVLVLLVAFGSVVAMGLPIGTALIGLGTGLGLTTVAERFLSIPTVAPTLATMIGLGVGIDYALFIVTRHREHLRRGMTVEESAARALATAGQAVVFAGVTVVIAICGLQFVGIGSIAMMGYAIAVTVLVSVAAAITLLPAFLGFAGHNVNKLKLPGLKGGATGHEKSTARRWSLHVSRHPWKYLLASAAVLLALIVPFFSIRLGQTDAGNDPAASTSRKAYDLLSTGFGPGFNGPLVVVVEKGDRPLASSVATISKRMAADPDVAFAGADPSGGINPAGDTAIVTVFPKSSPQDAKTQALVHRLRNQVLPKAREAAGVSKTFVTGSTAFFIDISDKVTSRLPIFIGAVLAMSFVLLMVVFRSILVPLKAGLMNLLGIGAAYGVVVAVFQWGWGASVIGVESSLPIISFLPMFMFAILFGLSMDYEVFLMSRVREEYLRTGDNTASVSTGISHTARVITAAAVIMVSVFGSFAFGGDPTVKMFGVGLATAIFLDATLIRMVLVPATMQLLGDRNWWLPGWLDRWMPHVDLEGEGGLPEPAYEPGRGPGSDADAAARSNLAGDDERDSELLGV